MVTQLNNNLMFVEVEIKISDLLNDLRNGLSWLEQNNNGKGSIQLKYQMEDQDVEDIKQHPVFQKPIRTFKIVDDTQKKQESNAAVSDVTPVQQPVSIPVMPEQEVKIELFNDRSTVLSTESTESTDSMESTGALEFLNL
jgi:hypothetical protein